MGPRPRGKISWEEKYALARVSACGWPLHTVHHAPLAARLQGTAELVTAIVWPYSTAAMHIRSSFPQPSVTSLPVQTCPRFGIWPWPGITRGSFIPIPVALLAFTGHTAPRIHFRLDCHGAKNLVQ